MGDKEGGRGHKSPKMGDVIYGRPPNVDGDVGGLRKFFGEFPTMPTWFFHMGSSFLKNFRKKTYVDGPKLYCRLGFRVVDAKH